MESEKMNKHFFGKHTFSSSHFFAIQSFCQDWIFSCVFCRVPYFAQLMQATDGLPDNTTADAPVAVFLFTEDVWDVGKADTRRLTKGWKTFMPCTPTPQDIFILQIIPSQSISRVFADFPPLKSKIHNYFLIHSCMLWPPVWLASQASLLESKSEINWEAVRVDSCLTSRTGRFSVMLA